METKERQKRQRERLRKRKRQLLIMKSAAGALILVIGILCVLLATGKLGGKDAGKDGKKETETSQETEKKGPAETELIAQADRLAAMYDYDGAVALLTGADGYEESEKMAGAVAGYEASKATCVEYPLDQVTHVFYHTLVYDTAKAFDGDAKEGGYNQVMTTVEEFNKITRSMYEKGYVLVSPHDMATVNEDGTVTPGKILLPPDKKAFVLSQDDVSYYHYMDGDGMATRLVVDENGKVKNEYVETDGSVSVGDYDMVPLIDTFVEEHPDFSYRGAKGTIALTGYEGVLGYRTDEVYRTREASRVTDFQQQFFDANPDFDEAAFEKEVEEATKVAEAMKASGWEFASHTWGHLNAGSVSQESLELDTQRWLDNVAPIVGDTDIIIFAFGADIGDASPYTMDNSKFSYLKSKGFDIYCNVDSSQYWVQFGDNFMRQGRRNLDGYRMYYNPEMVSDLFDAEAVFDKARTTPVPQM